MTEKWKKIVVVCMTAVFLFGFSLWEIIKTDGSVSVSERRPLAAFPKISRQSVLSGQFMDEFEEYALDQFPLRDAFRMVKAGTVFYAMGKKDNNGLYLREGYASKLDYPLHIESVDYAEERLRFLYDRLLKKKKVNCYICVIPDKNYFMAEKNGYPSMDYEALFSKIQKEADFCQSIDIRNYLELTDYYRTDSHWRQEKLADVAAYLAEQMGVVLPAEYDAHKAASSFYGSYYGQAALPLPADELYYLDNEVIKNYRVYDYETDAVIPVYDLEKLAGKDAYEIYLSGSKALISIENPQADLERELVIFRDSFGSSLAPLLAQGYKKTTLVDIRYIAPAMLEQFLTFDSQDILFLYSTSVLNNSETMK